MSAKRSILLVVVACVPVLGPLQASNAQPCQPAWSNDFGPLFNPGTNNDIVALLSADLDLDGNSVLYAGGAFTTAGGNAALRIAEWNGTTWSPLGAGMNDRLYALAVFDDGGGPALFAGGQFGSAGGQSASRIAKWDGATWSALGSGIPGFVYALAVFDDGSGPTMYVGGDFDSAGGLPNVWRIARWDGTSWSRVGALGLSGGNPPEVRALAVFDDGAGPALYVGGSFTTADGSSTSSNIAKWDGSAWSALATGVDGSVNALTVFDDGTGEALYAGGLFTVAGGSSASRIAKWDGAAWSALGSGVSSGPNSSDVRALAVFDDASGTALYAGGIFTTAGGVLANHVARWDGTAWSALGAGVNGSVEAFAVFDDGDGPVLFAGGFWNLPDGSGGAFGTGIAKWDGEQWLHEAPGGTNQSIDALEILTDNNGPALYVRGSFSQAGPTPASKLTKWNGVQWNGLLGGLGLSFQDFINDWAVFNDGTGDALFVAGSFSQIGGVPADNIARWDGAAWSPLGSGTNIPVNAVEVFDDGTGPALYAACDFFLAGGVLVNRIARWDGQQWSPLGNVGAGLGGAVVNDMAVYDDGTGPALYVGGAFDSAGGDPTIRFIAKWDGAAWARLGSGVSGGIVTALDVLDDGAGPVLYVRGTFLTAGGMLAQRIARWDGQSWDPLDTGVTAGVVNDIAVFDDGAGPAVYATGSFTFAGGTAIDQIASWDGTAWSSLGPIGLNGTGKALAVLSDVNGPALYVGGEFTEAGGLAARHVARWDGSQWSPVDIGIDGGTPPTSVNSLAVFDGPNGPALYAAGNFTTAGGVPSMNIARWDACPFVPGDFTGDGVVSVGDVSPFVAVLLGLDSTPSHVQTADMNLDGTPDGRDISPFVVAALGG